MLDLDLKDEARKTASGILAGKEPYPLRPHHLKFLRTLADSVGTVGQCDQKVDHFEILRRLADELAENSRYLPGDYYLDVVGPSEESKREFTNGIIAAGAIFLSLTDEYPVAMAPQKLDLFCQSCHDDQHCTYAPYREEDIPWLLEGEKEWLNLIPIVAGRSLSDLKVSSGEIQTTAGVIRQLLKTDAIPALRKKQNEF